MPVVDVAPVPIFSRLVGPDDGVSRSAVMSSSVLARRVVATPYVPAPLAHTRRWTQSRRPIARQSSQPHDDGFTSRISFRWLHSVLISTQYLSLLLWLSLAKPAAALRRPSGNIACGLCLCTRAACPRRSSGTEPAIMSTVDETRGAQKRPEGRRRSSSAHHDPARAMSMVRAGRRTRSSSGSRRLGIVP